MVSIVPEASKIVIVRLLGRQSLGLPIEPLGALIVAACLLLVTVGKTVESLGCARVSAAIDVADLLISPVHENNFPAFSRSVLMDSTYGMGP
jgi:hypothetical protein